MKVIILNEKLFKQDLFATLVNTKIHQINELASNTRSIFSMNLSNKCRNLTIKPSPTFVGIYI